jgi:hypothetical protein
MTTYYEIINVVERVIRMQGELPALKEAIATATIELAKADGLKKTIARCKLRDAETALVAKISEIDDLGTSIPSPDSVPYSHVIERIALLRIDRNSQIKVIDRAKSRLGEVNGKALVGSWRPKGALPPLCVIHAQKEVAIADADLSEIDRKINSHMQEIDMAENQRINDIEMDAWIRGEGVRPRVLVERDRLEAAEFERSALRLVSRRRTVHN